jgi:L-fuconolactonase
MIDFPVVDTHVHLLDTKRFKYSWASGVPKLGRDWSIADLDERARPYRIDRIVFAEVDVDMPQYLEEAEWVQTLANQDGRLQGCVACLPLERGPAIEGEMARLSRLPVVRGIRRLIQNQPDPDFVLKPDFLAAVKLLPTYNLSFDICIYHHQLPNTLRFVRQCPEVSFVLDHIAKPGIKAGLIEPWKTHIRELAAKPQVSCHRSGVTPQAHRATKNLYPFL